MWKDLGSQWERELIRHEDIPDLKDEDLIHANNKASSELEILKKSSNSRNNNNNNNTSDNISSSQSIGSSVTSSSPILE